MPAAVGVRRTEETIAMSGAPAPGDLYAQAQRYAISLLGIVIAIQTIPYGMQPIITLGQLATLSTTLQVGDTV